MSRSARARRQRQRQRQRRREWGGVALLPGWLAVAGLVLTLGLLSGGAGDAQADSREFTGRVARIDGKSMLIDNRKGDKVAFVRTDATVVRGEKKRWGDIAPNDWVMVTWDMMDAPQKIAHKVVVMPRKGDE